MRILHLNSLLTGGGTDDRSVRIAHALTRLGLEVSLAGPAHREFSKVAQQLGLPFHPVRPRGLPLIWGTARVIRRKNSRSCTRATDATIGPPSSPPVSPAGDPDCPEPAPGQSPSSWASRHFLLSQCQAMVAVSQFVAKVLREGDTDPTSDNPERHCRAPDARGSFEDSRGLRRIRYGPV